MRNDQVEIDRLWKLETKVNMLVLDGKRDAETVANVLQGILDVSVTASFEKTPASVPAVPAEKFSLLRDLGIITVPEDYVHSTRLGRFMEENRKKLYGVNDNTTDANFPNPTRILKPGDKLWVRAYQQIVPGTTTSEERMAFLATQKAVHTGAQGASLVFEQKRDQLPKGKWYASFDEVDRLWKDAGGRHRVPHVFCDSDGGFGFDLGGFEGVRRGGNAFLCFCDVE